MYSIFHEWIKIDDVHVCIQKKAVTKVAPGEKRVNSNTETVVMNSQLGSLKTECQEDANEDPSFKGNLKFLRIDLLFIRNQIQQRNWNQEEKLSAPTSMEFA